MGTRREGFSLIELVTILAVTAVLAAIVFPVFAAARERSRQSRCAGNLRQIGTAFDLYTQDWDGFYPPLQSMLFRGTGNPTVRTVTWKGQLLPYLGTNGVFACPSSPWYGDRYYADHPDEAPPSYAANQMVLSHRESEYAAVSIPDGSTAVERSVEEVRNSAGTILAFETRVPNVDYLSWRPGSSPFASAGGFGGVFRLHTGGQSNFLMADGHVKPMRVLDTLRLGMWGTPDILTRDWPRGPIPLSHPWLASAAPEYR
ncbi:MAG: DUF1559 family PulG-like putative transporter [Armatimonadota bacterium]